MSSGAHTADENADAPLQELLSTAKWAYNTRRVDFGRAARLIADASAAPRAGDIVLARIDGLGQHKRLELTDGRRATLYPGDLVCVAYGGRYAPDQFLARVPDTLAPCQLVAAGGIAGAVEDAHERMEDATAITPIGLLGDTAGERINVRDARIVADNPANLPYRPTIAVVGASMNAGKTTAAASLVRGLKAAGLTVGAAKATGTGAGGDRWLFTDSGADHVYDFTDAGVPSTFGLAHEEVRAIFALLNDRLAADAPDINVIEVADGLYHTETGLLLNDQIFADRVDGIIFACRDALSTAAGLDWLRTAHLPVLSISGVLTASALAVQEARHVAGSIAIDSPTRLSGSERALELYNAVLDARADRSGRTPSNEAQRAL